MIETSSSNTLATSMDRNVPKRSENSKKQPYGNDIARLIGEKWAKFKDGTRPKLSKMADDLYNEIARILDNPDDGKMDSLEVLENQIIFFLKNQEDGSIDDCILWLLLKNAVEKYEPSSENMISAHKDNSDVGNTNFRIIRLVLDIAPHLSFECPESPIVGVPGWDPDGIKKRCKVDHSHIRYSTTPFHSAAEHGRSGIIDHMLSVGKRLFLNEGGFLDPLDFIKVLRQPKPHPSHSLSALCLSAMCEEGGLETVKIMLRYNPAIAIPTDDTFETCLKKGYDGIVDAFLEYKELREEFVTAQNILLALHHLHEPTPEQEPRPESYMKVVCTLINRARTEKELNSEVVKTIIELNLKRAWESRDKNIELNISGFLHIAVQCQNPVFTEMFMDEYPDSVFEPQDDKYALWHNNYLISGENRSEESLLSNENRKIREMLVTKIIKGKSTMRMQELLEIFRNSEEHVDELCFDLSRFNSKKYPVSDFVRSLINHQDNPDLLSYERTLKYAEFPNLDANIDEKEIFGEDVHTEHTEVFLILNWLRNVKNVQEIMELTVPDRLVNPHNEVEIGNYVKLFQVQVLNWRFLDLSITVLPDEETEGRIRELHLYASGKRAAISHWTSEKGILKLPNLTKLEIHIIQDLMTKDNCYSTTKFISEVFGTLVHDINEERERSGQDKLKVNYKIDSWNPAQMRLADLEEISERAVPKLYRFIKSYRDYVHDLRTQEKYKFRPIKVAIIDNGVLSISPRTENLWDLPYHTHMADKLPNNGTLRNLQMNHQRKDSNNISDDAASNGRSEIDNYKTLWSRIKGGQSFVEDSSRVSPWLFASNPHGTQMANLICAIDPWCDLYVAKVTEGRAGIMPARVARAIHWAIAQKVDIISMSFAILEKTDEFQRACDLAIQRDIVLLCSTHDEGLSVSAAYPASFRDTITITACDDYGKVLRPGPTNEEASFQYKVHGQSVAAGVIPFLESDDYISGSSVATAITAGLSSLILSCDRIAKDKYKYDPQRDPQQNYRQENSRQKKKEAIEKHLKKMLAKGSNDYILLEKFARIDQKIQDGRDIDASEIISTYFQRVRFNEAEP